MLIADCVFFLFCFFEAKLLAESSEDIMLNHQCDIEIFLWWPLITN